MDINQQKSQAKQLEYELIRRLKQYEKELNGEKRIELTEPTKVIYERQQNKNLSDDELRKIAESEFNESYNKERKAITESINSKISELKANKDNLSKSQVKTLNDIETAYSIYAENVGNDALKRGTQRSSIASEQIKEIESDRNSEITGLIKEYEQKSNALSEQITRYEKGIDNALNDYDIEYAAKLNNKIKALKKEQDALNNKVIAYNNELTAKEDKDYNDKMQDFIKQSDQRYYKEKEISKKEGEAEAENGYTGNKKINYDKRYNLAYSFYSSLPKEVAIALINENEELPSYLGLYYNRLKSQFNK